MNLNSLFPFSGYQVKHVKVSDSPTGSIRVHLERLDERPLLCRCCGCPMTRIRGFERRVVEDLTVVGRKTYLHFRRLKARCPQCRKTRLEACDFVSPASPHLTSRLAFWLYRLGEVTPISRVAELAEQSKMTLWRVDYWQLCAYFAHYEIPEVTHLSVDEVYAQAYHDEEMGETRDDRFFTIITCLTTHKVVWVEQSRRRQALDKFFEKIGPERCRRVAVVATDQHEDYARSIADHCPNATHVLDRFHLMQVFEEAVNETRKRLFDMLKPVRPAVKELARPKYRFIFLKAEGRRTDAEKSHMARVLKDNEAFLRLELIKERMLTFFNARDEEEAWAIFEEMGEWIREAGFPDLKAWWGRFAKNWGTIANYFKFRVTTSLSESINNNIKALKRRARGYQNLDYFRLKILQTCGYLSSRFFQSPTAVGH